MSDFINTLEIEFKANKNDKIALGQKMYLRNQFEFYGLKSEERRVIQTPFFIKAYLPKKGGSELFDPTKNVSTDLVNTS